ncbi:MAG: PASTA domain-containing protein [Streptosporangiaceae bacterium]|jgi:serine/threonine-protein kinase
MESALADPLVGRTLDGRYQVRSRIAHGGMATVYLASDTRLDRLVALKVMHADLARDSDFVNRFIGEAKSVARLSHPNIVQVFDQGSDGHYLYLAMEFVPGRTLRSLVSERGRLPAAEALDLMVPVLSGLAGAHAAGIIHRDVKPENVLLTPDGRVKVVDFGLARAQASSGQTRTGLIIGTVAYLAPEQVTGGVTSTRSDVYAAGVLLFELLTGRQPHTGDTPMSVAYQHVNSDVPLPSSVVPGIPEQVDRLMAAATSRDPNRRPPDAAAFLDAVHRIRAENATGPMMHSWEPQPFDGQPWDGQSGLLQPAGSGANSTSLLAGGGGPAYGNHTMVVGGDGMGGYGGYGEAREPFLGRWLFSRRLAYLAVAVVVVAGLAGGAWWMTSGRYASVPSVAGDSLAQARSILTAAGFKVTSGDQLTSNTVGKGDVLSEQPSGRAVKGAMITLTLSAGPKMIHVPSVAGKTVSGADAALSSAGLTVSTTVDKVGSSTVAVGTVVGTNPGAGTSWPANKPVTVEEAAGIPLPTLTGQNISDVQQWAQQNDVNLQQVSVASNTVAQGIITKQSPAATTPITAGETVTVDVSSGPQQVNIPNVTNMTIEQARQTLKAAGFQVTVDRFGPVDNVFNESPTGQAAAGSTITIYAGL